ncbi:hypothetical protein FGIG_05074 [Fasciola gigantica]|uniref:Cuticle protein n=1 Tax=Fasciola gigantica TaxID=46835 RepID=A0A504Z668_FASGI|nr:hypothetical protein FGIG_05074 [Fasciola gigantica]
MDGVRCFALFSSLLLYYICRTNGAVASGLRFIDPNNFDNQQIVIAKSIPDYSFGVQTAGQALLPPDQAQVIRFVQQPVVSSQTMARFINPNDFVFPQTSAYPTQISRQPSMALGTSPKQSLMPTAATMVSADVDEVSPMSGTSMISPASPAAIIGSPNDGVIGPNGQILGSAHDTAVVDTAGQFGANLLQGKMSTDLTPEAPVQYTQDQVLPGQQLLYPPQEQPYAGLRLVYDTAGRPFLIQIPPGSN